MVSETTATKTESVRVWDPLVRVIHWGLAVAFAVAYLTAESAEAVHLFAGYMISGVVLIRLLWGVVGPRHARFSDFIFRPSAVLKYLRGLLTGRARRMLGHSPAGGALVIALMATCGTGIAMGFGAAGGVFEAVHEFASAATLALVLAHIAGVLFGIFVHRENLPLAMITGRKRPLQEARY